MLLATAASKPAPPLVDISARALVDLTPVVVMNRRIDAARRHLDGPEDGFFPTLHDDPRRDLHTTVRKATRRILEAVRGTYGEGETAGHTAYGSVRFIEQDDARRGAAAVMEALTAQGDVGARAYGPVTYVADAARLGARLTFSADDSGANLVRLHEPDELADVVAERLERLEDGGRSPDPDDLLTMPRNDAVAAVRRWLTSDELAASEGYIEAQVGGATSADMLAAILDARDGADVVRRNVIDPGATPTAADVEALRGGFARHGIPVTVLDDST